MTNDQSLPVIVQLGIDRAHKEALGKETHQRGIHGHSERTFAFRNWTAKIFISGLVGRLFWSFGPISKLSGLEMKRFRPFESIGSCQKPGLVRLFFGFDFRYKCFDSLSVFFLFFFHNILLFSYSLVNSIF